MTNATTTDTSITQTFPTGGGPAGSPAKHLPADHLAHAHQPPSEPAVEPPLLSADDLDDPERFHTIRRVPILDVHDDPEHGKVDEPLLRLIAKNSNDLVRRGHFPALILGHTRSKEEHDELEQPPVVGYATSFHLANFNGIPCLHADFHYRHEDHEYASTFPFRSVERLSPNPEAGNDDPASHCIDRIALLRTPPRRDLGVLKAAHYEQSARSLVRIRYARDLPAIEAKPFSCACEAHKSSPSPSAPASAPNTAVPPSGPAPALGSSPQPVQQPDNSESSDMAIAPEDVQAIASAVMTMLKAELAEEVDPEDHVPAVEEAEAPEVSDHYADNDDDYAEPAPDQDFAEDEDLDRDNYEFAEPSGSNTFTPGTVPAKERCDMSANRRTRYEAPAAERQRMQAESGRITRRRYERDLAARDKRIADLELESRRAKYEKTLVQLEGEGFEIDRADEMEEIHENTPKDFEAKREKQIRKQYRRSAVNQPPIPTADPPVPESGPKAMSRDQIDKVSRHASKKGISFAEAKTELGFK